MLSFSFLKNFSKCLSFTKVRTQISFWLSSLLWWISIHIFILLTYPQIQVVTIKRILSRHCFKLLCETDWWIFKFMDHILSKCKCSESTPFFNFAARVCHRMSVCVYVYVCVYVFVRVYVCASVCCTQCIVWTMRQEEKKTGRKKWRQGDPELCCHSLSLLFSVSHL